MVEKQQQFQLHFINLYFIVQDHFNKLANSMTTGVASRPRHTKKSVAKCHEFGKIDTISAPSIVNPQRPCIFSSLGTEHFLPLYIGRYKAETLPRLPAGINRTFHILECSPLWFGCLHFSRLFDFCVFRPNRTILLLFTSPLLFLPFLFWRWRDRHFFDHQLRTGICEWSDIVLLHGFQYGFSCTFVHTKSTVSRLQMRRYRSRAKSLKSLLPGIRYNLFVNCLTEFSEVGFNAIDRQFPFRDRFFTYWPDGAPSNHSTGIGNNIS
mmetsp:Transcript_3097/g.8877  ORF Transcript_3097/g.8877 Transcript_3097/m.8877 type:complete len:266 (-) Transcript_3097:216-1013(-)